jgi:hypothetical protein
MADRSITNILTSAENFDLLTLDEAKTMLGLVTTTPEDDAQLSLMISISSATVAVMCNNRTLAYEKLTESWRDLASRRVFLSHWPVDPADVVSVSVNGTFLTPADYELEPASGKMSNFNGWSSEPIVVTYSGGYKLPEEAPLPLKQAAILLIREERILMRQAQVAGIRQLSHKEARVTFFDPNALLMKTGTMSQAQQQIAPLLVHYTRFEV